MSFSTKMAWDAPRSKAASARGKGVLGEVSFTASPKKKEKEKLCTRGIQNYSIWTSRVLPDRTTIQTRSCLTSQIVRDAVQPLLQQLADEFPDCVVLAFADDVHILGPPRRAAVAYERWKFLYEAILQGQMNAPRASASRRRCLRQTCARRGCRGQSRLPVRGQAS